MIIKQCSTTHINKIDSSVSLPDERYLFIIETVLVTEFLLLFYHPHWNLLHSVLCLIIAFEA